MIAIVQEENIHAKSLLLLYCYLYNYTHFTPSSNEPNICEQACDADPSQCVAWTYVKPGIILQTVYVIFSFYKRFYNLLTTHITNHSIYYLNDNFLLRISS